jgi:hypothetical protein
MALRSSSPSLTSSCVLFFLHKRYMLICSADFVRNSVRCYWCSVQRTPHLSDYYSKADLLKSTLGWAYQPRTTKHPKRKYLAMAFEELKSYFKRSLTNSCTISVFWRNSVRCLRTKLVSSGGTIHCRTSLTYLPSQPNILREIWFPHN